MDSLGRAKKRYSYRIRDEETLYIVDGCVGKGGIADSFFKKGNSLEERSRVLIDAYAHIE